MASGAALFGGYAMVGIRNINSSSSGVSGEAVAFLAGLQGLMMTGPA